MRRALRSTEVLRHAWIALAAAAAACGLSTGGTLSAPGGADGDGGSTADAGLLPVDDSGQGDAGSSEDGPGAGDDAQATDADTTPDAACAPIDAGVLGPLPLSTFVEKGNAVWNENNDNRITLTNSNNNEKGAAWYPIQMPVLGGYDLTWSFRVGPSDTAGDGITLAIIDTGNGGMPDVGDDGDGVGLRNLANVTSGYAIDVDMFKNASDPTDLDQTTLKLVTMPGFHVVAAQKVPFAFNDGNTYAVDVSWRAPSTMTATVHTPGGGTVQVTSSDNGLATTGAAYLGFTGATGGGSDSHNEAVGVTVLSTCQ